MTCLDNNPSVQIQGLHVSNYKVLLRTIKEELNDLRTNLCFRAGEMVLLLELFYRVQIISVKILQSYFVCIEKIIVLNKKRID